MQHSPCKDGLLVATISRGPSLGNQVYKYIREQIISNVYKPGQIIVESELANNLNVSRTPISNAVIMLKERGLVEEKNGKLAILDLSISDVIDLYQCRLAFDGLAARLAAKRINNDELHRLKVLLEIWEQPVDEFDSNSLWVADLSFHNLIYNVSNNRHLIRFSEIATDLLSTYRRVILSNLSKGNETLRTQANVRREHEHIFDALVTRDSTLAEESARNHIENVILYLEQMQNLAVDFRASQLMTPDVDETTQLITNRGS